MKEQQLPKNQRVTIVLGMDRTGTSLCMNVLQTLGLWVGTDLLPPDQFNERGYFEDLEIWRVHERILALLGRSWDTLGTVRPFPPLWWESEVMNGFRQQLVEIARSRVAAAGAGMWGFKDPRTVLLLPLWKEVLQALDLSPVFVVCVRHPGGVAQSLSSRNAFPRLFSEMLWLEKTLRACQASWNAPNCLIHYEEWFADPLKCLHALREVTGLAVSDDEEKLKDLVDSIVSRALRHELDLGRIESPSVERLYGHLLDCTRVPDDEILSNFDVALATATEFIRCVEGLVGLELPAGICAPPYPECREEDLKLIQRDSPAATDFFRLHDPMLIRMQWMLATGKRQQEEYSNHFERAGKMLADREARLRRYVEGLAHAEGLLIQRPEERWEETERIAALESRIAALADEIRVLETNLNAKDHAFDELTHENFVLEANIQDREIALATSSQALDAKDRVLSQLRREKSELEDNFRDQEDALRNLHLALAQKDNALTELRRGKSELEDNFRDQENALRTCDQSLAQKDNDLTELRCELSRFQSSFSWQLTRPLRGLVSLALNLHEVILRTLYRTAAFRFLGKPVAKFVSTVNFPGGSVLIPQNPLFDADFYAREYKDVSLGSKNLWAHYLGFGADEGRNPHTLFDTRYYKTKYSDVSASGLNPLIHYFAFGATEMRDPHFSFNSAFYVDRYADVREGGVNPLLHYWLYGRHEGRESRPTAADTRTALSNRIRSSLSVDELRVEMRRALKSLPSDADNRMPLFSIITPTWNTKPTWFAQAALSVLGQTIPDWEWCIVDDASSETEFQFLFNELTDSKRFQIRRLSQHGGISAATNEGLRMARGSWLCFLDHDDELAPDALEKLRDTLQKGGDAFYSDSDKIDEAGISSEPFYKPDWSPEYFRGVMYVGHLLCVRRDLATEIGGFNSDFDGIQDYEFFLRYTERTQNVGHVAGILYHWRKTPSSIATDVDRKPQIRRLQKAAVQAHLDRIHLNASADFSAFPHGIRIVPTTRRDVPRVSIIIPTRDAPEIIGRCLDTLFEVTSYPNFEVICVDNGTTDKRALEILAKAPVRRVPFPNPFNFSRANNFGAQHTDGSFLVFLNNDIEVVNTDWVEQMLFYAEQDDIGAAGGLLLYPNGTVQHAGVVLGCRGTADHVMRGFTLEGNGYVGALACAREVSAVTAACLMVRKGVFQDLGGFNEHFRIAYQDVDFCLRIRNSGRRIILVPSATFIHYESYSRGRNYDHIDRNLLLDLWEPVIDAGDPYYNRHFDVEKLDYSLRS